MTYLRGVFRNIVANQLMRAMNYEDKDSGYYSNVRHDVLSLIDRDATGLKVMEIGAGYGGTLYYLKSTGVASEAVGVDIFEDVEHKERYLPLENFHFGDIEKIDFPQYYGYFDLILLPDVVEHLIEPGRALDKIMKYLTPGGSVIVSMPNVRHYSAFINIFIRGDFRYEPSGLFDYTHRRFFCRKNILELVTGSGFKVSRVVSTLSLYKGRSFAKVINRLTFSIFEQFLTLQYVVKGHKK